MIGLLLMLLAPIGECSLDVVGRAEVYFVAHYNLAEASPEESQHYTIKMWHDIPSYQCVHDRYSTTNLEEMEQHVERHTRPSRKPRDVIRFTYKSPIHSAEDEEVNLLADWYPVAYRWMVYNKRTKRYEPEKDCGDIPLPCTCDEWDGLVADPEACSLEVPKKELAYLEAYYLHEDPENAGVRYVFKSRPEEYRDDVGIDWEGYPEAVEWFIKYEGDPEFEPFGTCGDIPEPVL